MSQTRRLVLVLGDQLNLDSPVFDGFDAKRDAIVMAEVPEESQHVWSHKARTAYFFAAMRHFSKTLREQGKPIHYLAIGTHPYKTLIEAFAAVTAQLQPESIEWVEPGDFRIEQSLKAWVAASGVPHRVHEDSHFLFSRQAFVKFAGQKNIRMETFYRMLRAKLGILMEDGEPVGGTWNYDSDNRASFGKAGPGLRPSPLRFAPEETTLAALRDVEQHFQSHPGTLAHFDWPVTREQALGALQDFALHRLAEFGRHQDAMWADAPFLSHSLISMALNVKLLNPREVIAAAQAAHTRGDAPIESVEGFIRQVLGWREFIRGVYWRDMPSMADANHFNANRPLPAWYWTGETKMACMRQVVQQTLRLGYAHHIQRLMVTGNFALIAGILPNAVCDWYLAVYVDAIDWVERPNTAGMALYANGGRFTSKPYAASGAYIKRMSNYCTDCQYRPEVSTGPVACPVSTLYWHFIDQHQAEFARNPRTALMVKNLQRKSAEEVAALRAQAVATLAKLDHL